MKKMKYSQALKVVDDATDKIAKEMDKLDVDLNMGVSFLVGWAHAIDVVSLLASGEIDMDSDELARDVAARVKADELERRSRGLLKSDSRSCDAANGFANVANSAYLEHLKGGGDDLTAMHILGMAQGAKIAALGMDGFIKVNDLRSELVEIAERSVKINDSVKKVVRSKAEMDPEKAAAAIKNLIRLLLGDEDAV